MINRRFLAIGGLGGAALALALALAFALGSYVDGDGEANEAVASAGSGPSEGIQVHGHWTIEVFDDGALVSRREFDNALTAQGAQDLGRLAVGLSSAGLWSVRLFGLACLDSGGSGVTCLIVEPNHPNAGLPNYFDDLTVSSNSNGLTLSGTATAARDDEVSGVGTTLGLCPETVAPADCLAPGGILVTSTTLTPALSVLTNQEINVTVEISFTSP